MKAKVLSLTLAIALTSPSVFVRETVQGHVPTPGLTLALLFMGRRKLSF